LARSRALNAAGFEDNRVASSAFFCPRSVLRAGETAGATGGAGVSSSFFFKASLAAAALARIAANYMSEKECD